MSTLLVHVRGHMLLNKSIFRPQLYVYEDKIVYKRRHLLTHDELTVAYNHISQANLHRYIYRFAHIEIITTGQQVIQIKWVPKRKGIRIKKIIDEKIYQSHKSAHVPTPVGAKEQNFKINDFELSMKRLNELLNTGRISERDYKKRRKQLLKKHY